MHMSVFAYISLGLAACITVLAYFVSPDAKLFFTLLPMLLILGGIPVLTNVMNRRHVNQMDLCHAKPSRIRDLVKREIGEQVCINGTVAAVSHKWLNRPKFHVVDHGKEIGVCMFVAPLENIRCGDQVEVIGTLRWSFGFRKKEKIIWGLKMEKTASSSLRNHA